MSQAASTIQSTPADPQGDSQPALRISLLGPPLIAWSAQTLAVSRRQVRTLLYRLAADLQPIPREQLCDLLWPDDPSPKARRGLTHLLTHQAAKSAIERLHATRVQLAAAWA